MSLVEHVFKSGLGLSHFQKSALPLAQKYAQNQTLWFTHYSRRIMIVMCSWKVRKRRTSMTYLFSDRKHNRMIFLKIFFGRPGVRKKRKQVVGEEVVKCVCKRTGGSGAHLQKNNDAEVLRTEDLIFTSFGKHTSAEVYSGSCQTSLMELFCENS